ncbi:hypothetical protein B0H14DRAFT_2332617 [Mycena olivaceomarginata]|nr:hypothetical protein B0H14DRAFT_2332617 [Mycena olivaceomarginata]
MLICNSFPVIFSGTGLIPPADLKNYVPWAIVRFVFQYFIRCRHFAWWTKYDCIPILSFVVCDTNTRSARRRPLRCARLWHRRFCRAHLLHPSIPHERQHRDQHHPGGGRTPCGSTPRTGRRHRSLRSRTGTCLARRCGKYRSRSLPIVSGWVSVFLQLFFPFEARSREGEREADV